VIRAVLDTNTLASAAIASAGPLAVLVDAWRKRRFQVVVSLHILGELETTLVKPFFARRLSADARQRFLLLAHANTTIVSISASVPEVVRMRADNLVLATAESANAHYLLTGDTELLDVRRYKHTVIVSPRAFIELSGIGAPGG
jgi:putative PIN family toxin of toxin-antitoxin system